MNLVILDNHREASLITSGDSKNHIRAAAFLYGEARLWFAVDRLGTHSIRSGAATAMFLAGVPAETIQLTHPARDTCNSNYAARIREREGTR